MKKFLPQRQTLTTNGKVSDEKFISNNLMLFFSTAVLRVYLQSTFGKSLKN